jgi:hypothetical protein
LLSLTGSSATEGVRSPPPLAADAARRRQALRSERSQRPPGALELIDLGNQCRDFLVIWSVSVLMAPPE